VLPVKATLTLELRRQFAGHPHLEPVTAGIPFAPGVVTAGDAIDVTDPNGLPLPVQILPLARWPDGSVRWALLDVVIAASGHERESVTIRALRGAARPRAARTPMEIREVADRYWVDTGAAHAAVSRDVCAPFVALQHSQAMDTAMTRSEITLVDAVGIVFRPRPHQVVVETHGAVRVTLRSRGEFRGNGGEPLCRFDARVSFFRGTSLVRLDFTIHNPRRAKHPGGIWDLGDPGSIFFRSLSIDVGWTPPAPHGLAWRTSPSAPEETWERGRVEIYQASSGGEQWSSRNHVDRSGAVRLAFRGCRLRHGDQVQYIDRPTPVLSYVVSGMSMSVALRHFWQQFPCAIEGDARGLRIGLFPHQWDDLFEIQGGERKTYTVFFQLAAANDSLGPTAELAWVHDPLVPCLPPAHVAASGTFPYFVPAHEDPHREYVQLINNAVDGPCSFFRKRELIDEYGWRNFGDTYADHEDVYFSGEHPVISHYNNQYDLVYGFLLHFARTGDPRWFELGSDLARHVLDIDIYHTTEDKSAYSGGLFWHTDHYQDAGRSTHRSYTADSPQARRGRAYGGGPSNEHNYTTGLLYYYFLTGDPASREAVLELADWVVRMDDGTLSLLGQLDAGPSGLASCTSSFGYHGPGRGAGNSVNALIDAFRLTGDRRYLAKADELIARCVHPRDDPDRFDLRNVEARWSYLVFLQALGTYLDLKCELAERDVRFAYAQASLVRYARWMLEHEKPFLAQADRLEYPTESWAAQDVRKSCVCDYASRYGPAELRPQFAERAAFFFRESIGRVRRFPTHACARPLAVLLANGAQRAAFRLSPPAPIPPAAPHPDFGTPSNFLSQKERVKRQLFTLGGLYKLVRMLVRPAVLRRLASGRIW